MFGRGVPKDVLARLAIPDGEHVVAWANGVSGPSADGTHVVATDRALYGVGERLPWDRISRAQWDEPLLEVVVLDGNDQPGRLVRVRLAVGSQLPAAVHAKVTESVVVSERLVLDGGGGALAVARRGSDDDRIRWSIVFDAGLDPTDPALRAQADQALARLRDSLGV